MDSRKSDGKREKDIDRIVDKGAFGAGTEEARTDRKEECLKTKKTEPQVRWYHSETEDFVVNKNQDLKIPEDYVWVRTGR